MKILLTGKNGQVGFELQRTLAPLGEVHAVDVTECNLSDENAIRQLVKSFKPDLIVNPAAYTAVDKAESEPALAAAINTRAVAVFGEEAAKLGAWVIHYSTDYVFEGTKQGHYTEGDTANPQSIYGKTKRDGELALQQSGAQHLILRTSWVVGAHGANFAKTMLRLAAERDSLNVVADQYGAPTSAALLADITPTWCVNANAKANRHYPLALTIWLLVAKPTGATTHALLSPQRIKPAKRSKPVQRHSPNHHCRLPVASAAPCQLAA